MAFSQLTKGLKRRLMYVENKDGLIDGVHARIGWVTFSKTGRTIYYRGRSFVAMGGRGIRGNFLDEQSHQEYWISGVKVRGDNRHRCELGVRAMVDEDAWEAYEELRQKRVA